MWRRRSARWKRTGVEGLRVADGSIMPSIPSANTHTTIVMIGERAAEFIEEPLTSDPAWNHGFYTDPQAVQAGLRRLAHGTALTLPPHGFYREGKELWRSLGFTGDPMSPPEECTFDAERIPGAQFRQIKSAFGHLATFALSEEDTQAVDSALRELLAA